MAEAHCCSIAIVGGGCSGVLFAVQLFRNGFRGSLTVIEPRERLGNGLAYSTSFDRHLLNVPAGKMSALAPGTPAFSRMAAHQPLAGRGSRLLRAEEIVWLVPAGPAPADHRRRRLRLIPPHTRRGNRRRRRSRWRASVAQGWNYGFARNGQCWRSVIRLQVLAPA